MTRVYNNKMESNANELSSLHNGGNATSTSNVIPMRPDINRFSGYLYYGKGITYYKLEAECPEFGPGWKEIPQRNLQTKRILKRQLLTYLNHLLINVKMLLKHKSHKKPNNYGKET